MNEYKYEIARFVSPVEIPAVQKPEVEEKTEAPVEIIKKDEPVELHPKIGSKKKHNQKRR
jgi:hypothetical protein